MCLLLCTYMAGGWRIRCPAGWLAGPPRLNSDHVLLALCWQDHAGLGSVQLLHKHPCHGSDRHRQEQQTPRRRRRRPLRRLVKCGFTPTAAIRTASDEQLLLVIPWERLRGCRNCIGDGCSHLIVLLRLLLNGRKLSLTDLGTVPRLRLKLSRI